MEKIIFTDSETGEEAEFYVLEETQLNGSKFLLVTEEQEGDSDAYILKEMSSEEGETLYEIVEDETELSSLGRIFSELMDEEATVEF